MQDPGTRGCRWWKTADFSHSLRTAFCQVGFLQGKNLHIEFVDFFENELYAWHRVGAVFLFREGPIRIHCGNSDVGA